MKFHFQRLTIMSLNLLSSTSLSMPATGKRTSQSFTLRSGYLVLRIEVELLGERRSGKLRQLRVLLLLHL